MTLKNVIGFYLDHVLEFRLEHVLFWQQFSGYLVQILQLNIYFVWVLIAVWIKCGCLFLSAFCRLMDK